MDFRFSMCSPAQYLWGWALEQPLGSLLIKQKTPDSRYFIFTMKGEVPHSCDRRRKIGLIAAGGTRERLRVCLGGEMDGSQRVSTRTYCIWSLLSQLEESATFVHFTAWKENKKCSICSSFMEAFTVQLLPSPYLKENCWLKRNQGLVETLAEQWGKRSWRYRCIWK